MIKHDPRAFFCQRKCAAYAVEYDIDGLVVARDKLHLNPHGHQYQLTIAHGDIKPKWNTRNKPGAMTGFS
jgi:hypothetical protein